jgi:hypothetical protein
LVPVLYTELNLQQLEQVHKALWQHANLSNAPTWARSTNLEEEQNGFINLAVIRRLIFIV